MTLITLTEISPTILEIGSPGPQGTGQKGDKGDTGPPNTIAIASVITGAAGSNASATIGGTAPNQTLSLTIPRGDKGDTGDAATIQVGSVTTGAPGTLASVVNSGTTGAAILNFTIPQGPQGASVINIDGGFPNSTYGGITTLNAGGP